jgi:hypothetical protein
MASPQELPELTLLTRLIYELIDAHADTAELAAGLQDDLLWRAHLEYLRALQREGRSALAQIALDVAV